MDRARTQFVGVALAAFSGLQNSSGDDFAIHFELSDVLKGLTCKVVRLVHGRDPLRIEGAIPGMWIGYSHDASRNKCERKLPEID